MKREVELTIIRKGQTEKVNCKSRFASNNRKINKIKGTLQRYSDIKCILKWPVLFLLNMLSFFFLLENWWYRIFSMRHRYFVRLLFACTPVIGMRSPIAPSTSVYR